jgi:hypothetical protein
VEGSWAERASGEDAAACVVVVPRVTEVHI